MSTVYNVLIIIIEKILPISKLFSSKMKRFVNGRKSVIKELQKNFQKEDQVLWLHAASLGEYEQGVPVLEKIIAQFPEYKILISFFSPSGYEIKKTNPYADLTVYLPLDTPHNANEFIKAAHPKLALFVKYEVWPNYLKQLHKESIPAILVSGNFRSDQIYFKSYGKFMKKALATFDHLFVQTESSFNLLKEAGIDQVSISGDTRFDRVNAQLEMDNRLDFIAQFKNDNLCIVCGSTWPEDEQLLYEFINHAGDLPVKFIIAPHQIKNDHIRQIQENITISTLLFSEAKGKQLEKYQVFIVDAIGYLSKIYAYGDIAYVGGAAGKTGLHNILEPATFGLPIIIGKNYKNFPEAAALEEEKGLFIVHHTNQCTQLLNRFVKDANFRSNSGQKSRRFIEKNLGATRIITDFVKNIL